MDHSRAALIEEEPGFDASIRERTTALASLISDVRLLAGDGAASAAADAWEKTTRLRGRYEGWKYTIGKPREEELMEAYFNYEDVAALSLAAYREAVRMEIGTSRESFRANGNGTGEGQEALPS